MVFSQYQGQCISSLGRDRHKPGLAHNRKTTCKEIQFMVRKQALGDLGKLNQAAQEASDNWNLNSVPPRLSAVCLTDECRSKGSNSHQGDAKANCYIHSARKTRKLSMGMDGHTGPNAFISIICCCCLESVVLQFSFILELPSQCLAESFQTSEAELLRYFYESCNANASR